MNLNKPGVNSSARRRQMFALVTTPKVSVWERAIISTITDALVALINAVALMLGLNLFHISAPYWGCFWIILAVRATLSISAITD